MTGQRLRIVALLPFAALAVLGASCGGKDDAKGPAAPGLLTATAGDGQVTLNWQQAPRAERYIVYIAREPGITKESYDELEGGGRYDYEGIQPPFDVTGLQNGVTYFFVVTSVSKSAYEGPESGEVWANPSPWGPPSVLETLPGEAIGLDADVDAAGNLLAVWGRGDGTGQQQRIHGAFFDNSIGGWGSIASLDSAGGIAGTPSLAVHPGGDAFVSWRQGTGPDDRIWGAGFDSVNGWEAAYLLTDSGSLPARNPVTAFAGDDVFALWTQSYVVGTSGTLATGIFGRVAADGGALGAVEQRDLMLASTDHPRVVAGGNKGMAAWIQDGLVYTDEWSGSWGGAVAVVTTSDEPLAVDLATNENGDFVLLWTEQNLSVDLYAIRYDAQTGTWGDVEVVEQSALDVTDVTVAVCPGGEVVTVFTQLAGLHTRLMASRWNDDVVGWIAPTIVHESLEGDSETPYLVVDAECTAHAVWIQDVVDLGGPGTTRNVYSTQNAFDQLPEEWGNPLLVSEFGLNSSPVILVDGTGNVSALWEFYGATGEQIWFNRLGD